MLQYIPPGILLLYPKTTVPGTLVLHIHSIMQNPKYSLASTTIVPGTSIIET